MITLAIDTNSTNNTDIHKEHYCAYFNAYPISCDINWHLC